MAKFSSCVVSIQDFYALYTNEKLKLCLCVYVTFSFILPRYYLRFMDPNNSKELVDKTKERYNFN